MTKKKATGFPALARCKITSKTSWRSMAHFHCRLSRKGVLEGIEIIRFTSSDIDCYSNGRKELVSNYPNHINAKMRKKRHAWRTRSRIGEAMIFFGGIFCLRKFAKKKTRCPVFLQNVKETKCVYIRIWFFCVHFS